MKYPIGIQDFRRLREEGYVYVDKTPYIHRIINQGSYFFLSRPRRFGKSLLISTLRELYSGSRELFEGLWIADHWNWEQTNPVIHLKFASIKYRDNPLQAAIGESIRLEAQRLGIELAQGDFIHPLEDLIVKAHQKYGRKTVLLIDEHDKPIIDYLDNVPQAEANRNTLKWLYSIIKDSDPHLELVFITGVSAFSKVSIFSDLNNLKNLSLHQDANAMLGITAGELEHYFMPVLAAIAEEQDISTESLYQKVRHCYNGYSWGGAEKVYNPFSLLGFLDGRQFKNFWFETGTPTFLIKEVKKHRYYALENQMASELLLNEFDFENLNPVTVLFQTGYLTIQAGPDRTRLFTLGYPNLEVKSAFEERLLNQYSDNHRKEASIRVGRLFYALEDNNMEQVVEIINATFAGLPYDEWQMDNEHFFHALIHLTFSLLGVFIQSEVHTATGRCDALVQTDDRIYVFEFKLDKSAAEALRQIRERNYFSPYADSPKEKIAVGINFSSREKKVTEWEVETW